MKSRRLLTLLSAAAATLPFLTLASCSKKGSNEFKTEIKSRGRELPAERDCPPGMRLASNNPPACESTRKIQFGVQSRFSGLLRIDQELVEFTSDSMPSEPAWVYFKDPNLNKCIGTLTSKPRQYRISFIGRAAPPADEAAIGNGYGHLGIYKHALRLDQFLSGNPCRSRID